MNEKELLMELLKHPAGYCVQMEGWLEIRVTFDGICVCEFFDDDGENYREDIYQDVEEAVDKFLEIRHRNKLGLEYWVADE